MKLQRFDANTAGRDFVVGDLHGCLDLFRKLLHEACFDYAADRVFSVGDLIDRGPDSIGCLRQDGRHLVRVASLTSQREA